MPKGLKAKPLRNTNDILKRNIILQTPEILLLLYPTLTSIRIMGLKIVEIKYVNFKRAKLSCPTHNIRTHVDLTINKINYNKCCDMHVLLCENVIEDLTVEIELARILKKLDL